MERKFLEELGLDRDNIEKIMAEYGKDINAIKTAEGAKLQAANTTILQLQETIKKYDGVDVEKLQNDLKKTKETYETEINKLQLNYALEKALTKNKARSAKAVMAFLDMSKIKLDGETLIGLDDQLKTIKESEPYLFEQEDNKGTDNKENGSGEAAPSNNASGAGQSPVRINSGGAHGGAGIDYDKMSDEEYYAAVFKKKE